MVNKSAVGTLNIRDLLQHLDVDGDGDIDEEDRKLGETLKGMDKDGDGTISLRELVNIGQSKLQDEAKIKNLRRMVVLVILGALAFCGLMLGLMLAANEASKDSKPESSGNLKTIDGKDVSTTTTMTKLSLAQLPKLSLNSLEKVKTLRIQTTAGLQFYVVSGWQWISKTTMNFFTIIGHVVAIENGTVTITDETGSTIVVVSRRRSILQDDDYGYSPDEGATIEGSDYEYYDDSTDGSWYDDTTASKTTPTAAPTTSPTAAPTTSPTAAPTGSPTAAPTGSPTSPTTAPTSNSAAPASAVPCSANPPECSSLFDEGTCDNFTWVDRYSCGKVRQCHWSTSAYGCVACDDENYGSSAGTDQCIGYRTQVLSGATWG